MSTSKELVAGVVQLDVAGGRFIVRFIDDRLVAVKLESEHGAIRYALFDCDSQRIIRAEVATLAELIECYPVQN